MTLSGISVNANERLVVLVASNTLLTSFPGTGNQTCTYDGVSMAQDSTDDTYQVNNVLESSVFSLQPASDTVSKNIVFNAHAGTPADTDTPKNVLLIALKIKNLLINDLDVAAFPIGGLGGDLGNTSVGGVFTSEDVEMLIGAGFCMGPVGDADGSWANSFNAGQIDGSTGGADIDNVKGSEGYLAVDTTGSPYRVKKTGIGGTSAQSYNIMHLCAYK